MDDSAVKLSSTNTEVGNKDEENALVIKFKPEVVLAPTNMGVVVIKIPDWYNIDAGAKQDFMFDESSIDTCSSPQLKIDKSVFSQGNLRMRFMDIDDSYVQNSEITISCKGFRNPIYPGLWNGFALYVYDIYFEGSIKTSRPRQNLIMFVKDATLDTSQYSAVTIVTSNFHVTLSDPLINTPSWLILNLDVPTPLDETCYIKITLPRDLQAQDPLEKVVVSKIFKTTFRDELEAGEFCQSKNPPSGACRGFDIAGTAV